MQNNDNQLKDSAGLRWKIFIISCVVMVVARLLIYPQVTSKLLADLLVAKGLVVACIAEFIISIIDDACHMQFEIRVMLTVMVALMYVMLSGSLLY